jgi:hypothetical protein
MSSRRETEYRGYKIAWCAMPLSQLNRLLAFGETLARALRIGPH